MQPEVQQQNTNPSQPTNPVVANAFQSSVPTDATRQQVVSQSQIQLPKDKKPFSGLMVTVILVVLLIASLGFGIWAFMGMQDYKTKSDQKSTIAVEKALADQKVQLEAAAEEKAKSPYDSYTGPSTSGSIKFDYPRNWSAYIIENEQSNTPVEGYFYPKFVPDIMNVGTAFALRIEVSDSSYADTLKQYDADITQGNIKSEPYVFPSVSNAIGSKLTGSIKEGAESIQGTLILMPLRDKTIKLWTESNSTFLNDLNTAILPSFTFVP
ncbi:hypothetical protein KC930_02160 [Candidatus Saccharibacteria bacterium]|nr:hypothetical protein [Candidatus Saccharibacteria bacterium]